MSTAATSLSLLALSSMPWRASEWLLVTGVSSGVRCAADRRGLGARVIGTFGSA